LGRPLSTADDPLFERAARLAAQLPDVERSTTHGSPALKVGGKVLANLCREPGALSVYCPLEIKAGLIEAAPDIYFDTPHFSGWPAVLVRMDAISDEALAARLEAAWMLRAPARLRRQNEASGPLG
jgi:hypothetical protein